MGLTYEDEALVEIRSVEYVFSVDVDGNFEIHFILDWRLLDAAAATN